MCVVSVCRMCACLWCVCVIVLTYFIKLDLTSVSKNTEQLKTHILCPSTER